MFLRFLVLYNYYKKESVQIQEDFKIIFLKIKKVLVQRGTLANSIRIAYNIAVEERAMGFSG